MLQILIWFNKIPLYPFLGLNLPKKVLKFLYKSISNRAHKHTQNRITPASLRVRKKIGADQSP
jgi:hypothetical protein